MASAEAKKSDRRWTAHRRWRLHGNEPDRPPGAWLRAAERHLRQDHRAWRTALRPARAEARATLAGSWCPWGETEDGRAWRDLARVSPPPVASYRREPFPGPI